MKTQTGLTLIEILITVALIIIVVGIGFPALTNFVSSNRTTANTNLMVAALNIARSEAAKRGASVSICISDGAGSCDTAATTWENGWIIFVDNVTSNGDIDAGETVIREQAALEGGMTIRSTQYPTFITFRGDGSIATGPGTFRACGSDADELRAKAINLMGSGIVSQAKDRVGADEIVEDITGVNIVCP